MAKDKVKEAEADGTEEGAEGEEGGGKKKLPMKIIIIAAVAGVLVNMVTLEGHGFGELQIGIYIGIVLGAAAIPLMSAAVARGALQKVPAFWMRLAWRIIASWSAAITLMYMTFQLKAIVGG